MIRRHFFTKFAAALGLTIAAPLAFAESEDSERVLIVEPKKPENGGLSKAQQEAVNKLNVQFRKEKRLKTIAKRSAPKVAGSTEKGLRIAYYFDSKASKDLYVQRKNQLLAEFKEATA